MKQERKDKRKRDIKKWLSGSLIALSLLPPFPVLAARSPESVQTELLRSGEDTGAEANGPGVQENSTQADSQDDAAAVYTEEELNDSLIQYNELEELIKRGNAAVKSSIREYDTNLEIYQEALTALSAAKQEMEENADDLEEQKGSAELIAQYKQNESQLGASVAQMNRNIRKLTGVSGTKSLKTSINTMVKTAQTIMCSYNQMRDQTKTAEKQEESAQAEYEKVKKMEAAGMASEQELLEAQQELLAAQISLQSVKNSEMSLKSQLAVLIGKNAGEIEVGEIPQADDSFLGTVDLEEDKRTAIASDSAIQSLRKQSSEGSSEKELRYSQIAEAKSQKNADMDALYNEITAKIQAKEAASQSYEAAKKDYQALQTKVQAGILSRQEYLAGQVSYLQKEASFKQADRELSQAIAAYQWEIKGI